MSTGGQAGGASNDFVDGGAQAEARIADRHAHVVEEPARLGQARSPGRDAVEDAEEGGCGSDRADQVGGGGHGLEVVHGRSAGDDDQVRCPGGGWAERTTGRSGARRSPQLAAVASGSRC